MPKVELHCHLEGALRPSTIVEIHREHGLNLPSWDIEELNKIFVADGKEPSLMKFLQPFPIFRETLRTPETIERAVHELIEDQARENVCYLEIRFSPGYLHLNHKLDYDDIFRAVVAGVQTALNQFDMVVTLTPGLSRELGPEIGLEVAEAASRFIDQGVTIFDLFGNEADYPPQLFVEVFDNARDYGLGVTIHAGEAAGPENVVEALDKLGAARIGHGCRAVELPALVDRLADNGIFVEMCPTSNILTGAVSSLADHPLPILRERGVAFGVFTDDPTVTGTTLSDEYEVAISHLGMSPSDLRDMALNALDHAFAPDDLLQAPREKLKMWEVNAA